MYNGVAYQEDSECLSGKVTVLTRLLENLWQDLKMVLQQCSTTKFDRA